jgi:hypothetical protein
MSNPARFICLLVAFILFVIEAVRSKSIVAAGLAAWVLVPLWDAGDSL